MTTFSKFFSQWFASEMMKSVNLNLANITLRRKCLKQNIWGKSFLSSSTDRKRYLLAFLNLSPEFPISVEYASLQSSIISGRSDSFGFLKVGNFCHLFKHIQMKVLIQKTYCIVLKMFLWVVQKQLIRTRFCEIYDACWHGHYQFLNCLCKIKTTVHK